MRGRGERQCRAYAGSAASAERVLLRQRNEGVSVLAFDDAQVRAADGLGIIAASKNGLSDCDGDKCYASLHVGATAWYILAVGKGNPFRPLNSPF